MKRFSSLVAILCLSFVSFASTPQKNTEKYVYTDASVLPLYGKVCENTFDHYTRLPLSVKESLEARGRQAVWRLGLDSAGEYIRFSSDAGEFDFFWASKKKSYLNNMNPCGARGLALYVWDKNKWVFVNTARPNTGDKFSQSSFTCTKLAGEMHEYMLYLSLYDGIDSLEIGVPAGSRIEDPKMDYPKRNKPFVIYGTSIMQGCSASHPGMCSSAMLGRMLNREIVNLGFSGNAHLDYEIAELMAAYPDPGCFVMDNIPNGSAEMTREKLEGFIKILRDAHPDVPIVFIENPLYPRVRFDKGGDKYVSDKNKALRETYDKMRKNGLKHTVYVRADKLLPEDNVGTAEGTHFTDIGFQQYSEVLYKVLKKF